MIERVLVGGVISLAVAWGVLAFCMVFARPRGSLWRESLRLLPDMLRLLRRLAGDRSLPQGVRVRLMLLFAYLAMPIDIIPDFIPVIGYADDVIIACMVLRSVVRRAGFAVVRRHWPGTRRGLAVLARVAGLKTGGQGGMGKRVSVAHLHKSQRQKELLLRESHSRRLKRPNQIQKLKYR